MQLSNLPTDFRRFNAFASGFALTFWAVLVGLFLSGTAHAGMFTELGGGIGIPKNDLFSPACVWAVPLDIHGQPLKDQYNNPGRTVACGGRNPVFIGWPIAWESANGNTRVGWFHKSNLFDGPPFNHNSELPFDCICASHKFRWSR